MFNNSRIAELENKVSSLEHIVERDAQDRRSFLDTMDRCVGLMRQLSSDIDELRKEKYDMSDKINEIEGMIDIFKNDISEIRGELLGIAVEEDMKTDETS